jgi:hypothetical protein
MFEWNRYSILPVRAAVGAAALAGPEEKGSNPPLAPPINNIGRTFKTLEARMHIHIRNIIIPVAGEEKGSNIASLAEAADVFFPFGFSSSFFFLGFSFGFSSSSDS